MRKDFDARSEDDRMIIERILILVRNILEVPKDSASEKRTEDDATVHDQILWVLHKSGMEDLMLFIASSTDEAQYCLHVLEIISLMFREQVIISINQEPRRFNRTCLKSYCLVIHFN